MKLFSFVGAPFNELSKMGKVKLISKGCSYVVLSVFSEGMIGIREHVKIISKGHANGEVHDQIVSLFIAHGKRF